MIHFMHNGVKLVTEGRGAGRSAHSERQWCCWGPTLSSRSSDRVNESDFAVVLFYSTQGAIRAERALMRAGLGVKLIPTPRQFSSDCGTALRCAWVDVDAVCAALREAGIEYGRVHRLASHRSATGQASVVEAEGGEGSG